MLQDDEHITITEIQNIQDKGRYMTLDEKDRLESYYNYLQYSQEVMNPKTKIIKTLTAEQRDFVRYVLPVYIKRKLPKLDEVMVLYNLNKDDIFIWIDTSEPWRDPNDSHYHWC